MHEFESRYTTHNLNSTTSSRSTGIDDHISIIAYQNYEAPESGKYGGEGLLVRVEGLLAFGIHLWTSMIWKTGTALIISQQKSSNYLLEATRPKILM